MEGPQVGRGGHGDGRRSGFVGEHQVPRLVGLVEGGDADQVGLDQLERGEQAVADEGGGLGDGELGGVGHRLRSGGGVGVEVRRTWELAGGGASAGEQGRGGTGHAGAGNGGGHATEEAAPVDDAVPDRRVVDLDVVGVGGERHHARAGLGFVHAPMVIDG